MINQDYFIIRLSFIIEWQQFVDFIVSCFVNITLSFPFFSSKSLCWNKCIIFYIYCSTWVLLEMDNIDASSHCVCVSVCVQQAHTHSHRCLVSPTVVSSLTVRQGSSLHLLITISSWRVKWRSVPCLTFEPLLFMWRTSNPVLGWLGWALMRPHVCPLWAVRLGCPAFIPDHLPLM